MRAHIPNKSAIWRRAAQLEAELEHRRLEAMARARDNELEVAHQQQLAELERLLADSRTLRELVATLPQVASAVAPRATTLHLTQLGDGRGALDAVPAAVTQLIARSLGLALPKE